MKKYDCIIILSHDVTPNRRPSKEAKQRIDLGIELFNQEISENVIFNGGPGKYTKIVDGEVYMKWGTHPVHSIINLNYAKKKGFPEKRAMVVRAARDTVGEAYFVKKLILEKKRFREILIVTSDYHIKRCKIIYNKILGPRYSIDFKGVKTKKSADVRILQNEDKSIATFMDSFGNIKDGDSKEIEKVLYNEHKLYREIPKKKRVMFYQVL